MRQARDELGVKVKKRWMAFLDSHTRDAHADLDGQVAEVEEPFDSLLRPIMYPGDPEAEPANVYNCRCTIVYEYPEYPTSIDRVDESGENVGDMSYSEWREMKAAESENNAFTGRAESGIMNTGALNGYSKRADKHAVQYYESVRHMKTDTKRIAENTGWSVEDVQKVKEHVFFNTHDLGEKIDRFDPSYFIAQSWQRLIQGKDEIREEDIVLLNHELMERRFEEQGMTYGQAHAEAQKFFNYSKYLPPPEE